MNEYEKLLVLLTKNEIRFIVVGGFACVFNGHVRPTEDVDIIVDDHISNLKKLISVLSGYHDGYAHELSVEDFPDEEGAVRLIEVFPIDIFTRINGKRYSDLTSHIRFHALDGHKIPFLDASMLVWFKEQSLRERDQMDVAVLKHLLKN